MTTPIVSKNLVSNLVQETTSSNKTLWIALACISILALVFFAYRAYRPSKPNVQSKSPDNEEKKNLGQDLKDSIQQLDIDKLKTTLKAMPADKPIVDQKNNPIMLKVLDTYDAVIKLKARFNGHTDNKKWNAMFEALMQDQRVKINFSDANGQALIHRCFTDDLLLDSALLKELLKRPDCNTDVTNGLGETALHLALIQKNTLIVKQLLDKGADPKIKTKDGDTPLELCVVHDLGDTTINLLLDKGAHPSQDKSLLHAVTKNKENAIRILKEQVDDDKRKTTFESGVCDDSTNENSLLILMDDANLTPSDDILEKLAERAHLEVLQKFEKQGVILNKSKLAKEETGEVATTNWSWLLDLFNA